MSRASQNIRSTSTIVFAALFGLQVMACATSELATDAMLPDSAESSIGCFDSGCSFCEVTIDGAVMAIETGYLINVLACENPNGGMAALTAQAIALRTHLYFQLDSGGSIDKDAHDYQCGATPSAVHSQAVAKSSGLVLQYNGKLVAAYSVLGAEQTHQSCTGGTEDPSTTEQYVTYNLGQSGDTLSKSSLGTSESANRGCLSQNGANCLADYGRSVFDIIHFYYGEDIEVVAASGECISAGAELGDSAGLIPEIGSHCVLESSCDENNPDKSATCLDWTDTTSQIQYGVCSTNCVEECGSTSLGETFCVAIDGQGQCLVVPSAINDNCEALPGTTAAMVIPPNPDLPQWHAVCAPPVPPVPCMGEPGVCTDQNLMACDGTYKSGICPGPANILCCQP